MAEGLVNIHGNRLAIGSRGRLLLDGMPVVVADQEGQPDGLATLDADGKVPNAQLHLGEPGGPASLDGSGKISAAELPPLQHDTGQAANEAAMLALNVSAPAIVVRSDFTPAHIFMLTADPATELSNWHDTGELGAGAANPSVTAGLTAKNGVASTYMRSDGAPALDQSISPTWTGTHTFDQTIFTQDIVLTNMKVTGMDDGAGPNDAVNKGQLDAVSAEAVKKGGQAGPLTFGTNDANGITMLLNGNPFMVVSDIGNTSFNTGTAPSVPFMFGGGIWTQAGGVTYQINPTSGTDASVGTISNHPVNLISNGTTHLTLAGGQITAPGGYTPSAAKSLAPKDYVDTAAAGNVKLTGNQTVAGVKTFSSSPVVPAPTADTQASTKLYVDTGDNRAPTNTVRGGVLQQAAIADAAAAPTQAEFNAVLAALRSAGVLAT